MRDEQSVKVASGKMGRPKAVSDDEILRTARRCFIEQGAGLSAADIASVVGVSHTTLFNRFGSKRGLMLAALAPPDASGWIGTLEAGPDPRSIRDQLVELGKAMSSYFEELQARLSALQGAGIAPEEVFKGRSDAAGPAAAFRALSSWLEQARDEGRLGHVDTSILATTILTAFQNRAFAAQVCGEAITPDDGDVYVARFFGLIWNGIAP